MGTSGGGRRWGACLRDRGYYTFLVADTDTTQRDPPPINVRIVFFPTFADYDPTRHAWRVRIRGWAHEAVHESLVRRTLLKLAPRLSGVHTDPERSARLRQRLWPFVAFGRRAQRIEVEAGGARHVLPPTSTEGHVQSLLVLPADAVRPQVDAVSGRTYLNIAATGTVQGTAEVELIGPAGVSVISDIDDTIKVSHVTDRNALLSNTLLHAFRSVPGMSDVYRRWESQGASFHYVSGSPWQLFEPLQDLLREAGFPRGSMDMRTVRLRQLRLIRFGRARAESVLGPPTGEKRAAIREILETFPARRFILCGDTGEEDPELYGELAGAFPRQIVQVLLRNVTGESAGNERIGRAFADVEPGICRLFTDPAELPLALL